MIEAVARLPRHRYEVVVGYTGVEWGEYLSRYYPVITRFEVKRPGGTANIFWRAIRRFPRFWRIVAPFFDPLLRQLRKEKCGLWLFPAQEVLASGLGLRGVVSVHDLMHRYQRRFEEVSARGTFQRRERVYRAISNYSAGVLVDSRVGKEQFIESYGASPSKVYELPFCPPPHIQLAKGEEVDGLPEKYLFYPAQFWRHKNHKVLLDAMVIARSRAHDIHIVFSGGAKNAYVEIRQLVERYRLDKQVTFLGYVSDQQMVTLYRNARGLIMPTHFGPTNIPPLEAIALGCPVAVSDIYGMREQLGEAALYFNPDSVSQVMDVMAQLWDDDALCSSLVERGRDQVERWTQADFVARVHEIIAIFLH